MGSSADSACMQRAPFPSPDLPPEKMPLAVEAPPGSQGQQQWRHGSSAGNSAGMTIRIRGMPDCEHGALEEFGLCS